jgi:hypothetical protein
MVSKGFESAASVHSSMEEPQFVDERTVIAARRVVPLRKLRGGSHLRGGLLAGAFALALVLGAATALLAVYLTSDQVDAGVGADNATDYVQPQQSSTSQPGSVAVVNTKPDTAEPSEIELKTEDPPTPAPHKKSILIVTPKPDSQEAQQQDAPEASHPTVTTLTEPTAEPVTIVHQPTLYDQWQERRQRRAARLERRSRDNYGDRDLFRIDEIFEGARRRPRL